MTEKQKKIIEDKISEIRHRQNKNLISFDEETLKKIFGTLQEIIDNDDGICAFKLIGRFRDIDHSNPPFHTTPYYQNYNEFLKIISKGRDAIINN